MVAVSLAAFPLLKPHGPGHITPCDLLMGITIIAVLMWAGSERYPVRLPYALPVGIMVVAGLVAVQFSVAPDSGALAIGQDLFVFLWAGAIATFARDARNLSVVFAAWVWSAAAWAGLVLAAVATHQWWIVGVHSADGARAQLWFDNPNMAGNYFLVSLFVTLLGRYPRGRLPRLGVCSVLLIAIVLTGSNAALLSLVIGMIVVGVVAVCRRTDLLTAIAVSSLVVGLVAGAFIYSIQVDLPSRISDSSNTLLSRSVARGPKSAAGRSTLFSEEFQLFRTGSLIGRGPASTQVTLEAGYGSIVKEAHDDYLATLVERGPVGVIGLLLLAAGLGIRAFSVSLGRVAAPVARLLASPGAAAGAVLGLAVTATTHEILHYRHVWTLFGLLAALHLQTRPSRRDPVGVAR